MISPVKPVSRKVVYRLYPSHSQEAALLDMLGLHQRLHNAALEQRLAAWRLQRKSLSAYDQMRDLTDLRADDERYARLNAQSAQVTLNRLHLAFTAFFRRCKKGETPGFPRFRSFDRFSGWGYKTHGDGFRFTPGDGNRHGRLRLSGIGTIQVRGRARMPGEVKTCEIQQKAGRWYASLTITCEPQRGRGSDAIGLDWGIETFATLAHEDGTYSSVENPRFFGAMKAALESAQQNLARKAKRSKNRAKARKRVAAIQRKTANRRHDFLHQKSARVVASVDLIATESLSIKNMVRSAKGTIESPGRNVAQKAGLNREILATAPRAFLDMLRYKAAEAGVEYIEVPSRKVKPNVQRLRSAAKEGALRAPARLRLRRDSLARSERRTRQSPVGVSLHRPGTDRVHRAIRVNNTKLHPVRTASGGVVHRRFFFLVGAHALPADRWTVLVD